MGCLCLGKSESIEIILIRFTPLNTLFGRLFFWFVGMNLTKNQVLRSFDVHFSFKLNQTT